MTESNNALNRLLDNLDNHDRRLNSNLVEFDKDFEPQKQPERYSLISDDGMLTDFTLGEYIAKS